MKNLMIKRIFIECNDDGNVTVYGVTDDLIDLEPYMWSQDEMKMIPNNRTHEVTKILGFLHPKAFAKVPWEETDLDSIEF